MILLKSSILLFLLSFSFGQQFPTLPSSYSDDVEANILDKNMSIGIREYVNLAEGVMRYETNSVGTSIYSITNINTKQIYNIVQSNTALSCTQNPYVPETIVNSRSTRDLVAFSQMYPPIYSGTNYVRGVPCDTWTASVFGLVANFTSGNVTTLNCIHNLTIQYYFNQFRGANNSQIPMRATLVGNRTCSGIIYNFNHNYEFINFFPGAPLDSVFTLPPACVGYVNQVINALQTPAGGGLAAGMFFLGLFFGAAICGLAIWLYCKRRQSARDRFASSVGSERQ